MRNFFIVIFMLGGCAAHSAGGPLMDTDGGDTDAAAGDLIGFDDRPGHQLDDDQDGGIDQDSALGEDTDAAVLGAAGEGSVGGGAAGTSGSAGAGTGGDTDAGMVELNVCDGVGPVLDYTGNTYPTIGKACTSATFPAAIRCPNGYTYDGTKSHNWTCGGPNTAVCPACVK